MTGSTGNNETTIGQACKGEVAVSMATERLVCPICEDHPGFMGPQYRFYVCDECRGLDSDVSKLIQRNQQEDLARRA